MIMQQKKQHLVSKKKVKDAYSKAEVDLQNNINALFDDHEERS